MMKKMKSIVATALIATFVGTGTLGAHAATKTVKASGTVSSICFLTTKPTVYLYTYNSSGKYVSKHALSSSFVFGNKYKFSLGSTKLDDKKVSKVCLQVKSDCGTKYSTRVNLKAGEYTITLNNSGIPTLK